MVTERKKTICAWLLAISLAVAAILAHYYYDPWGFYRKVSPEEAALRMAVVQTAESYLGCREEDMGQQAGCGNREQYREGER